jgi:hypothetical protein
MPACPITNDVPLTNDWIIPIHQRRGVLDPNGRPSHFEESRAVQVALPPGTQTRALWWAYRPTQQRWELGGSWESWLAISSWQVRL